MNDRTVGERVCVIEEVVTRMEATLNKHIEKTDTRISRLEQGWKYAAGGVSVITTGIVLYVKSVFTK